MNNTTKNLALLAEFVKFQPKYRIFILQSKNKKPPPEGRWGPGHWVGQRLIDKEKQLSLPALYDKTKTVPFCKVPIFSFSFRYLTDIAPTNRREDVGNKGYRCGKKIP